MGWNDFSLPGAGERFDNEDGTSRQEELARCKVGEAVELVREPDNPHDDLAIAIYSVRGAQVGYIPSRHAAFLASKIDRGYPAAAIIQRIKGANLPASVLGLVLRLNIEGEESELSVDPERVRWAA